MLALFGGALNLCAPPARFRNVAGLLGHVEEECGAKDPKVGLLAPEAQLRFFKHGYDQN